MPIQEKFNPKKFVAKKVEQGYDCQIIKTSGKTLKDTDWEKETIYWRPKPGTNSSEFLEYVRGFTGSWFTVSNENTIKMLRKAFRNSGNR